ncbi:putative signaling protein [Caenibius tardaugens NBRC 16725]|uniref:Putative signaling protein n=1 Tax=Caenibius tardaugens NBRC 16725 TaxID=1219035 RepID=U2ZXW5_9SPHN|nr:EAL domain-containing protein [Caenibius tardaugens]GAD47353.1 putative signaling protein [Caenibius tardaugens NBRC 16725]
MSIYRSESQTHPADLPLRLLLGFGGRIDANWGRFRSQQVAHLVQAAFGRSLLHLAASLAIVAMFADILPAWALLGWMAAVLAAIYVNFRTDRCLADLERHPVGKRDFQHHLIFSALLAALWAVPMAIFTQFAPTEEAFAVWGVLALLMTGAALWQAPVPLGAILFIGITGGSVMLALGQRGEYLMVAIVAIFILVAVAGTINGARNYLMACIAEEGVAEKNEVVSLLLREFEESEADWLWQTDSLRRVRSVSPRFAYALGQDADAVEGSPFLKLIAGSSWETGQFQPSLHDLAERMKRQESFSNIIVRVDIGGQQKWWELSGTPKLDDTGKFIGFRGVGSDVTEQRESSDKIAYLARYDTLTGLPNRMMLMEALGDAMKYADQWKSRCAFMMIDLDRFKQINDSLGHQIGDRLLAQVAERLKSVISSNELCGRLGGDEFAIVVRDASDKVRVDGVAQSVITLLSQPYEVDNHTLYVGSSVGSATGPRDGVTVETLMRNADLALYRAKDAGRGCHVAFEHSLHQDAEERRKLELSLRHALERNELSLNYQPVVDAQSEDVVSFEALLRWISPEHGSISPAKFIPLAEETRLIVPIGEWVLREACKEAMRWPDHIKVAVNVSGEQLLGSHFASTVVSALSSSGLDPRRLEIEVTESIFLRDDVMARATLEEIIALGCSIALDDFGTGYSSLGYLRKLRFSTIKVDRSFVQGAAKGNVECLAIIRAVVAMASSLDMSTTAEGVENGLEAQLIRELGCKKIQGYHFGRPMAAEDVQCLFPIRAADCSLA